MSCCCCFGVISTILALIAAVAAVIERKFHLFSNAFRKIDPKSTRAGGELVAKVLQAHGVKHVFTLVGGHISPILVAAEKLGIRVVDTRHEVNAVFAADAMARMSGTVGVAIVTAGPGVTNTITAVKNAQMAESPLLVIGGAAATILKGRGSLQDIDQISLFKSVCKFTGTVTTIREIVPILKKALCIAQSGTPGPVFLEFPIDTLYPYNTVIKEVGMTPESKTLAQRFVNFYLRTYINNVFAGAWDNTDFGPLPVQIPMPNGSQVAACAELIAESKKPLFIVGSQSVLPPVPADDLRKALEGLGIPCYLSGMARGLLGRNSPIQMRQKRREAAKETDVVVLAGTVCDFRLGYGRILNKKSKIIVINRDKVQLYKNSDLFWKPTLAAECDVASFLLEVSRALQGYKCSKDWVETLSLRDQDKEEENKRMSEDKPEEHLNPLRILNKVEEAMDNENAVIVADGGDFVGTAAYILRPRGPLQWLDPGPFGTLGVGGGFALGAKLCRPESEVWIIYGDGSCAYSILELDTFKRHNTPVIAVIGNDAAWMQMARDQVPRFGTKVACFLEYSDYQTIAEAFGGKGLKLGREDNDRIDKVLLEAKEAAKNGQSVVVNALIGKTAFREGSISI